jgi:hypothetical protein
VRAAALTGGIPIVFVLVFVGGLFGLNGSTWIWWRWGSYAAATVAAIVTAYLAWRRKRAELGRGSIAAILIAIAAIVASLTTMGQHFNDSYHGNLVWPHLLACVAFAGVLVVAIAILRAAE